MKNITKRVSIVVFLLLQISEILYSQNNLTNFEINKALGRGINMGNMFEAPSEGEWGNPYKEDYFQKISNLGFNHVRIPIRWDVPNRTLQTQPYTINSTFLARIKSVVDNAIANKLYVVINMHQHEGIFIDPAKDKAKFLSQWMQIADYFKGYEQKLLFEVLNEPHDKLTPALWNVYFADAVKEIRKTNPKRAIVMGMANYGGLSGLPNITLPDDNNIIIAIHYYEPFNFTHQGAEWVGTGSNAWLGTKWEDLEAERKQIISDFDFAKNFSANKKVPITIGEFGAYSKADIDSRTKWTTFLARWFEQQGWSWAYWEWSAGFGIYDPTNGTINNKLADALLKNPMPEPKKVLTKTLYQSSFTTDNDGWSINVQPGSTATLTRLSNGLIADIQSSVINGWHVQLNKTNVAVVNKKRYQVTVKAIATNPASVSCYIGKNSDPYNSYSGYSNLNIGTEEKEFSYTFLMNDPTDNSARITFDMGLTKTKITISSIKLEEILQETTLPDVKLEPLANETEIEKSIQIAPNPAANYVKIIHHKSIKTITLFDEKGKPFFEKNNNSKTETTINLSNLPAGIYFVYLYSGKTEYLRKLIKY
jgi:aryl-phospho-beta-D-glucosidase BglC (GH1 family)